ncbi:MAG: YqeG family HAD IIIA-type phosphatase [Clostridiales bacterium]|jgi:HAD superfamily phosphatase (TIGR01668 family)|nr:YqeG family HAD IIIA-type phosphatase [Clostridiales bacterium]
MSYFAPDYYYDSVFMIPYDELWKMKIRGLIFDIDNTLTRFDEKQPSAKIVALMKKLERMGFRICLVTNNTNKRLGIFNKNLSLPGIANAIKPLTRGLRSAMSKMGTKPAHTVIIGDQVLSDIWAGKNAQVTTILVKPISEKDFFLVRAKRVIERMILRKFFHEHKIKQGHHAT